MQINQRVLPAIKNYKDLKTFLTSSLEYGVVLNFHLAQLPDIIKSFNEHKKKAIVHLELIKGLAPDEFGALYLIQNLHVHGILGSKSKVVELCHKRNKISIFRIFLKDSMSLEQSAKIANRIKATYVEVLPSNTIDIIDKLKEEIGDTLIFGGLIYEKEHALRCLNKGATMISTSNPDLWFL